MHPYINLAVAHDRRHRLLVAADHHRLCRSPEGHSALVGDLSNGDRLLVRHWHRRPSRRR